MGSSPTLLPYSAIHYNNNVIFFSSLNEITSLSLILIILKSTNCLFAEGRDGKWLGKKVVIDQFL